MLSRRCFLAGLGATALAAGAGRPNIVLLVADDLGAHDLGCYGADLHETPHLDQLARDGVRFTRSYSAAPVCSPTRAALLTGQHPARLRLTIWLEASREPPTNRPLLPPLTNDHLPLTVPTLPKALQQAGYATLHVGKWHLGGLSHSPEAHGYDASVGATHWGAPETFFFPYRGDRRFRDGFRYVPGLGVGKPGDYLTDKLTDKALELLGQVPATQPFFLSLWFHNPHTPIEGKPALVAKFKQKLAKLEASAQGKPRQRNATYAAMIASLDENVGRVLAYLRKRGLAGNTLVLFTSDNGGYLGSNKQEPIANNAPLRSGKGSLYEGGIRVPLLAAGAGVAGKGRDCAVPVNSADLPLTIAKLTGVALASGVDGQEITPLLGNRGDIPARPMCFHYPHYYETTTPVSAIMDGDWKLLHYYEDDRQELYNLQTDPAETKDLAGQETARKQQMLEQLRKWLASVKAQYPSKP